MATGVALAALTLFGLVYALSPQPPVEPLRPDAIGQPLALPAIPAGPEELASTAEQVIESNQNSPFAGITQAPPPPPKRTEPIFYQVEPGDVLWEIAERFGLRSETLLWANDELRNPDLLLVGQKLLVPPVDGVFYTVQPGERLAEVALRYGVEVRAIADANRLAAVDQVQWGVDLFLPGARPVRPAALSATSQDALVLAPESAEAQQQAALAIPPVPLPANIEVLLQAGWLRAEQSTVLFRGPEYGARKLNEVPVGARLERIDGFKGGRIQVRDPGDGRSRQAMTGWVNAMDLDVGRAPPTWELPQAYPRDTAMNIAHVFAPYRTQLDGSRYADANCGPTTIGMALDAFGVSVASGTLRTQVLNTQRIWGNDVGTLITALAEVVKSYGLKTIDLYAASGGLYRWSLDDIREQVAAGRPVVVQVRYRALPGRGLAAYYGDHYILVTGALDDGTFLYNDSINHDGLGWDRAISGDRLRTAMSASATAYAYSAFAVTH